MSEDQAIFSVMVIVGLLGFICAKLNDIYNKISKL